MAKKLKFSTNFRSDEVDVEEIKPYELYQVKPKKSTATEEKFKIKKNRGFEVKLKENFCSCLKLSSSGIPCQHIIAVCKY